MSADAVAKHSGAAFNMPQSRLQYPRAARSIYGCLHKILYTCVVKEGASNFVGFVPMLVDAEMTIANPFWHVHAEIVEHEAKPLKRGS